MGVVTITWHVPAPQPASISLSSVSFFLPKGRESQSEEVAGIQKKPRAHPDQPQNPTHKGCTLPRRAVRARPSERGMKGGKQLSSCRPHPSNTDSSPTNKQGPQAEEQGETIQVTAFDFSDRSRVCEKWI